MSQVISFPPASHLLFHKALSPFITILSRLAAKSLSKSFAVTSTTSFSLNRLAVSLTTAKASGSISFKTSSIESSIFDSIVSISS
jgi:hypothetical protein